MTAAEAHAAAASEGLALLRSNNPAGFKNVSVMNRNLSKRFRAQPWHSGNQHNLGLFATAEEAALTAARFLGSEVDADAPAPEPATMTPAEARAKAASEGLTLLPAENTTGYKGVYRCSGCARKPFKAQLWRGQERRLQYLGNFETNVEAALAVARFKAKESVRMARFARAPVAAAEAHTAAGAGSVCAASSTQGVAKMGDDFAWADNGIHKTELAAAIDNLKDLAEGGGTKPTKEEAAQLLAAFKYAVVHNEEGPLEHLLRGALA